MESSGKVFLLDELHKEFRVQGLCFKLIYVHTHFFDRNTNTSNVKTDDVKHFLFLPYPIISRTIGDVRVSSCISVLTV